MVDAALGDAARELDEKEIGYILDARNGPNDRAFWWGPNGAGYTSNLDKAGLYTRQEYERRIPSETLQIQAVFVPRDVAERASHRTVWFDDLGVPREAVARQQLREEIAARALRAVTA